MSQLINSIICDDCLNILPTVPDNSINLIYIDPPYGTKRNLDFYDNYSLNELIELLRIVILECKRIMTPDGNFYIHGDYRFIHYIKIECDKIFGIDNFINEIIWYFNSGARKRNCFGKRHNTILRYSKGNACFNPPRIPYSKSAPRGYEKEKYYHPDGKVMDDVWKINIIAQNDKTERVGYSTQKPLKLLRLIIESSCNNNDIVLDCFCGSGTTLVAAKQLRRRFIGIDINEVACEISKERLNLK